MPKGTIRPIIPWAKEGAEAQMNEDVRDKARTLGLGHLTEEHLAPSWSCHRSGDRSPEEDRPACQIRNDGADPRGGR